MALNVCIDPGVAGTGVVTFHNGRPDVAMVWTAPAKLKHYSLKAHFLGNKLYSFLQNLRDGFGKEEITVYCEEPAYMAGAGGQMVAAGGDLVKLCYCVGVYGFVVAHAGVGALQLVPVRNWKGQLPKEVVEKRCRKELQKMKIDPEVLGIDSHAWDALGIGLFIEGRL